MRGICVALAVWAVGGAAMAQPSPAADTADRYRPLLHFSPRQHWINDPNGMVYHKGVYHLFFQHYPQGTTWGPMHWGHATSTNLVHWQEQSIKLFPDSLGYIFSGSAVADVHHTSGFGQPGDTPLVAIFTHHNPLTEKRGRNFQYQSLAYSLDDGATWHKYVANPVLADSNSSDFRDPKVFWYAPQRKWIMTLATKDCISFYSSPNLRQWQFESVFGKTAGAHGGVWECPDLVEMDLNGQQYWVLIVNLNPGAPNGGSGTQYFVGRFDGHQFTPLHTDTRWMDHGPDNYAGVTWSNTGRQRLLIGWMSNWDYANQVPTGSWRNAMTVARQLSLQVVGKEVYLRSVPVQQLQQQWQWQAAGKAGTRPLPGSRAYTLRWQWSTGQSDSVVLRNAAGEQVTIGYDAASGQLYLDRTKAGRSDFHPSFARRATAPLLRRPARLGLQLIVDACSLELFADDGLTVLTSLVFPTQPYTQLLQAPPGLQVGLPQKP